MGIILIELIFKNFTQIVSVLILVLIISTL